MEIVIESPCDIGSRNRVVPSPEYFSSLANQRLLNGAEINGSIPVLRVDRSGLLEMPLPQHSDTSSRRVDRSGLLESVSEVPDHIAYAKSRLCDSTGLNNDQRHLTGGDINVNDGPSSLTLPRCRRRERRGSFEPSLQTDSRNDKESGLHHVQQMVARFSPSRTPTPTDTLKQKSDVIDRLKNDHRVSSQVALSIPDVIEAHEPPANGSNSSRDSAPEGERAEAEGCEHTAIESLEEARVSFKAQKNIVNNDNIQTLRVIILSEQL